jgi:hypothetical protein
MFKDDIFRSFSVIYIKNYEIAQAGQKCKETGYKKEIETCCRETWIL